MSHPGRTGVHQPARASRRTPPWSVLKKAVSAPYLHRASGGISTINIEMEKGKIMRTTSILLLAGAALGLAACGGSSTEAPAPETSVTEAPAMDAPAEPAAEPAAETAASDAPAEPTVTYASLNGDPARGERVFAQCRACHVADPGVNRVGPSLHGVVGRTAGSVEGFRYSAANRNSGLVWSEEQLFTYLEAPQRTIPGTTMAFAGLRNPQDRADVIAYLKTRA